jgi:hypothetical protein
MKPVAAAAAAVPGRSSAATITVFALDVNVPATVTAPDDTSIR